MRRNALEFVEFVFQWKNLFHNIFAKSSRGSSKVETSLVIGNELTFKVDLRYLIIWLYANAAVEVYLCCSPKSFGFQKFSECFQPLFQCCKCFSN